MRTETPGAGGGAMAPTFRHEPDAPFDRYENWLDAHVVSPIAGAVAPAIGREIVIRKIKDFALLPHGAFKHLMRRQIDPLWQIAADASPDRLAALEMAARDGAYSDGEHELHLWSEDQADALLDMTGRDVCADDIAENVTVFFEDGPQDYD
jgi:hypothetical protein